MHILPTDHCIIRSATDEDGIEWVHAMNDAIIHAKGEAGKTILV